MVNEKVNIRDKQRIIKKTIKILLVISVIFFVLLATFLSGFLMRKPNVKIYLENPIAGIVLKYTDEFGVTNKALVIEEGVMDFNEDYINYILVGLGVNYLHSAPLFGNPVIEFNLEGEIWNSEIIRGAPQSKIGSINKKDLIITISKQEAVESLLCENIEDFMKNSVKKGNTKLDLVAGKTALFSKGYLDMYKKLTGEEISLE
jgi:hypothetical protein